MKTANAAASLLLALFLSLSAALGIAAASDSPPSLMSHADRLAALQGLQRDFRVALARCRDLAQSHDRAVCRAEVRAAERIAVAGLDARYRGTVAALERSQQVRARAAYSIAVARRLPT